MFEIFVVWLHLKIFPNPICTLIKFIFNILFPSTLAALKAASGRWKYFTTFSTQFWIIKVLSFFLSLFEKVHLCLQRRKWISSLNHFKLLFLFNVKLLQFYLIHRFTIGDSESRRKSEDLWERHTNNFFTARTTCVCFAKTLFRFTSYLVFMSFSHLFLRLDKATKTQIVMIFHSLFVFLPSSRKTMQSSGYKNWLSWLGLR